MRRLSAIVLALLCLGPWAAGQETRAQSRGSEAPALSALALPFAPADPSRRHLDIGGVWAGTRAASPNSDEISFIVTARPDLEAPIRDARLSILLPAGVELVGRGSVDPGPACSGIVGGRLVVQADGTIAVALRADSNGSTTRTIPASCRLTIGVPIRAGTGAKPGELPAILRWSHASPLADAEPVTGSLPQQLVLRAGDPVLTVRPLSDQGGYGTPLVWQVVARNAGGGGLFDVLLTPADLGPGLRLLGVTPVEGADARRETSPRLADAIEFDYLPAGAVRAFVVEAVPDGTVEPATDAAQSCAGLVNKARLRHRLDAAGIESAAGAAFDISQPLVRFLQRPTDLLVGRGGAASGRFSVENAGDVPARAVAIETDFPESYDVSVRTPNWRYETGRFVYQGEGLDAGARDTVLFDVEPTGICPGMAAQDVAWQPLYRNTCGATLRGQRVRSRLSSDEQAPRLAMSLSSRLAKRDALSPRAADIWRTGQEAGITLTLDGTNIDTDGDSSITVTHKLPDLDIHGSGGPFGTLREVTFTQRPRVDGASVSCGGDCRGGDTITWSVPAQSLRGATGGRLNLDVDFKVVGNACLAGHRMRHETSAALSDASCPVQAKADFAAMLVNGTAGTADAPGVQQEFSSSPGVHLAGLTHTTSRTGEQIPAPKDLRGDVIQHEARYVFPANAVGLWDTSRFADDFGAADLGLQVDAIGQAVAPGTLAFSLNGGPPRPFPDGAVFDARGNQCNPAIAGGCVGGLDIDLSFIAGPNYLDAPRVSGLDRLGSELRIFYATIVPPTDLGSAAERRFFRKVTLSLADPAALGACAGKELGRSLFIHGDYNALRRDTLKLALDVPETISVCEAFPVSLAYTPVGSPSRLVAELLSRGPEASADGMGQAYVVARLREDAALQLNGSVSGAIAETTGDGSGFRVTVGDERMLDKPGEIAFAARLLPGQGDTEPAPLGAWVALDDRARRASEAPDILLRKQSMPRRVGRGDLKLSVVPGTLTVDADQAVRWWIKVSNLGDGPSVNTEVLAGIPSGLQVSDSDRETMMRANAAALAGVEGSSAEQTKDGLSWNLGRLDPGQSVRLSVQASPAGICVAEAGQRATASAVWGCGVPFVAAQTVSANGPLLNFPAGKLQVEHLPTEEPCLLCGDGTAEIVIGNVGAASLTDVVVREDLDTKATGLAYRPGSTEVSLDGGKTYKSLGGAGDPDQTQGLLIWTAKQIAELAELGPPAVSGAPGSNSVRIRFGLRAGPQAFRPAEPTVQSLRAEATASQICGVETKVASADYAIDIAQPLLKVIKTGRNVTQGGPSGTKVFGGKGDVIEWRLVVRNEGDAPARHVRLDDLLSESEGRARIAEYSGPGSLAVPIEIESKKDFAQTLPDLPPGEFATLLVEEVLGGHCGGTGSRAPALTFGCASVADAPKGRLPGIVEQGPIMLSMKPRFDGIEQSFRSGPDGRGWVTLSTRNEGGTASALVIQNHLPHGLILDRSVPVRLTVKGTERYSEPRQVSGVRARDEGQKPIFEFDGPTAKDGKGRLRYGESLEITFAVMPGSGFDLKTAPFAGPEKPGSGDPEHTVTDEQNGAGLAFESTCGADADATGSLADMTPLLPDVDISVVDPEPRLLRDGESTEIVFAIGNAGDEGSIASHVIAEVRADGGFKLATATLRRPDGTEVTCPIIAPGRARCDASMVTPLAAGAQPSMLVLSGTARDNGEPLRVLGLVSADLRDGAGVDTGNDLSLDAARPLLAGFSVHKQVAVTDQPDILSGGGTVLLGERVGWDLRARWFGLGIGEQFAGIELEQSFPEAEVAYVETPGQLLKGGRLTKRPKVEQHGVAKIKVPNAVARKAVTANADLSLRMVGRVVGGADAVPGSARAIPGTISFTAKLSEPEVGKAEHRFTVPTDPSDAGAVALDSRAAAQAGAEISLATPALRLRAPALRIAHGVANTGGQCGGGTPEETALGDAGDWLTYTIGVSNNAPEMDIERMAPVFGAVTMVTLPEGVTPVAGSFEVLGYAAGRHEVVVDQKNPRIVRFQARSDIDGSATAPGAGSSTPGLRSGLARIEPGETVTMQFCAVINDNVETGRGMVTDVRVDGSALPPRGKRTEGVDDAIDQPARAAARLVADASAAVAVLPEGENGRAIVAATANAGENPFPSASLPVLIGETVWIEATTVLPAGTARDLRLTETLPPGLAFVPGETKFTHGPGISDCEVPEDGAPDRAGNQLQWSFGDCTVATAATAEARRLTLKYGIRILDSSDNVDGKELTTSGVMSVRASGVPVVFPFPVVTLTVREPAIALDVRATVPDQESDETALGRMDAGDSFAVDVTLISADGVAVGHDLLIAHSLPEGLAYVPGSMTGDLVTEPKVSEGMLTWGLHADGNGDRLADALALGPGETLSFGYRLKVRDTVVPGASLPSIVQASWSSLPGAVDGERIGKPPMPEVGGTVPTGANVAAVRLLAGIKDQNAIAKRRLRPIPEQGGTVRIGERIRIGLDLTLQEGRFPELLLRDTLAPGLVFERLVSISSGDGQDGPRYEIVEAPEAGQSGEIVWRFKDLVNPGDGSGDNDTLSLVYEARLLDDPGILPPPPIGMRMRVPGTSASLAYENARGPRQIVASAIDEFRVGQPILAMKQSRVTTARLGTVGFGAGDRISYSRGSATREPPRRMAWCCGWNCPLACGARTRVIWA